MKHKDHNYTLLVRRTESEQQQQLVERHSQLQRRLLVLCVDKWEASSEEGTLLEILEGERGREVAFAICYSSLPFG